MPHSISFFILPFKRCVSVEIIKFLKQQSYSHINHIITYFLFVDVFTASTMILLVNVKLFTLITYLNYYHIVFLHSIIIILCYLIYPINHRSQNLRLHYFDLWRRVVALNKNSFWVKNSNFKCCDGIAIYNLWHYSWIINLYLYILLFVFSNIFFLLPRFKIWEFCIHIEYCKILQV